MSGRAPTFDHDEARRMIARGMSQYAVAELMGTSRAAIQHMLRRKPVRLDPDAAAAKAGRRSVLSDDKVARCAELHAAGVPRKVIAGRLGIAVGTVAEALRRAKDAVAPKREPAAAPFAPMLVDGDGPLAKRFNTEQLARWEAARAKKEAS